MITHKNIMVIIILLIVICASYAVPRAKYSGTNFTSELNIHSTFEWRGTNVSESLNINTTDTNFNFINNALAYNYVNSAGRNLLFVILDAGNFHHPKVCFTGAGYKIKELRDTEFTFSGRIVKAHTLFTERRGESFLSFYWIVIDKKIAHDWIEQKIKQLYFSMFNKKRVGLMIRIDIPTREDTIEESNTLARQFITDVGGTFLPDQADYIFGEIPN